MLLTIFLYFQTALHSWRKQSSIAWMAILFCRLPFSHSRASVLVHIGDLNAGHYISFIRPEKNGGWFKFDDDRVIPVTKKEAQEDNFGGEAPPSTDPRLQRQAKPMKRFANAYMLVYIRESDLDEILAPITTEDIPQHLRTKHRTLSRSGSFAFHLKTASRSWLIRL